jgi:hypothetical protein
MSREEFSGAAARTTLASGINNTDLSFTVASGTGHPTGTNPFIMVIDRGLSTEEKIRCTARSGAVFTVHASGRGYDGTTAQSHSAGAYVEHVVSAAKLDELDAFVNSAFTGDVTAASGAKVTSIANSAVTTAKIADDAVTYDKLLGATATARFLARTSSGAGNWEEITAAQALALLSLDSTDLSDFTEAVQDLLGAQTGFGSSGLTFTYDDAGNAVALVVNVDGATIEISSDALRVKAGGIGTSHLANDAVTADKAADGIIDAAPKIADDIITAAKINNEARTSYTPTVRNSGQSAVTITNTSSRYSRVGREIRATVRVAVTSVSGGTGDIEITLPVSALDVQDLQIGTATFLDASVGPNTEYFGAAHVGDSGTSVHIIAHNTVAGAPFTTALGVGDILTMNVTYEAAS